MKKKRTLSNTERHYFKLLVRESERPETSIVNSKRIYKHKSYEDMYNHRRKIIETIEYCKERFVETQPIDLVKLEGFSHSDKNEYHHSYMRATRFLSRLYMEKEPDIKLEERCIKYLKLLKD